MIYWTLIPRDFSTSIEDMYIKIHSSFNIPNTVGVWGYGNYGGTSYVYNGYIEMQSDGALSSDEYMTILIQFPSGTFKTKNKLNKDFNYYYNMAEKGVVHYTYSSIFSLLFPFLYYSIIIISIFIFFEKGSITHSSFSFGSEGKNIPYNVPYFRNIPCNNDLFRTYYIAYQYGLLRNKADILGAIILKWLKNSLIRIEQKETSEILKKENTIIILNETNPSLIDNSKEQQLFRMLYDSSNDGVLENREFEKRCKNSYFEIFSWFDDIINTEKLKLIEKDLIIVKEKTFLKIFGFTKYCATSKLKQQAIEIAGFKKYLKNYSIIKEREAIEVNSFEDYLIFAQMLGIAKKVTKQFKEIYPVIIEQSNLLSYDNITFINMWSAGRISEAKSARSRARIHSSRGRGFSSGGGGGGSFGGGGSGGGFR